MSCGIVRIFSKQSLQISFVCWQKYALEKKHFTESQIKIQRKKYDYQIFQISK